MNDELNSQYKFNIHTGKVYTLKFLLSLAYKVHSVCEKLSNSFKIIRKKVA